MGNAVSAFRILACAALFAVALGKLNKLADEKVQFAIVVIVEPNGAGGPSGGGYTGFFSDIRECAVTIVVVENVSAILRNVDVRIPISIVVANGHTLAVSAAASSSFDGHVGKRPVAIVVVERVTQGRIGIEKITLPAVHQVDVHPAVVIVVKKSTACPGGLWQVMLHRLSRGVGPGDIAHERRDLRKCVRKLW